MNIILAGAGKIGFTLAQYLTREHHNITVIDRKPERIAQINSSLDVITVCGSVDIDLLRRRGDRRPPDRGDGLGRDEHPLLHGGPEARHEPHHRPCAPA